MVKIIGVVLIFLFLASPGCAEDIYIAQSLAGGDTGASCANAHSAAWLNTAGNWGAGADKLSPGDTAHLCGNITTALTIQASGTAGNIITILFEPGATMSVAAWAAPSAIYAFAKDYITIDGGATGTIGGPTGNIALVNGIIQNTDNGTGLSNQVNAAGIKIKDSNYITVQNLAIYDMYVRTAGTETNDYGAGISLSAETANSTNLTVTNCIIRDAHTGVDLDYADAGADYTVSYVTAYNCNWGGRIGDRNASSRMDGLYVHHNKFYGWTNWNETATNQFHHNGFYGWAESGGQLTNAYVYANEFGPNYGGSYSTSGVFFSGNVSNLYLYNNLFLAGVSDAPATGMLALNPNHGYTGHYIYNNTFIGAGAGNAITAGEGTGTYTIKNNIASGVATAVLFNYSADSTLVADNNLWYDLKVGENFSKSTTSSSSFKTFAEWQALGYDANGLNVDPSLDGAYKPDAADDPVVGTGVNLYSVFTTDKDGYPRPESPTVWDMGAYKYDTTAPTVTAFTIPANSSSLTVTISSFTATDAVGVTGFCIQPTNSSTGCTWYATAPATYPFGTQGAKTLYAFAKDAAGNISTNTATDEVDTDGTTITLVTGGTVTLTSGSNAVRGAGQNAVRQ
jgi:hypothetical protein